jgi:putative holliday junction resolvase
MRSGVRIGVDVGSVRIGVAACDPGAVLATPVETVKRGAGDLERLVELATEREAIEFVVGLPTGLSGRPGPAVEAVNAFVGRLAVVTTLPIRLVDERLTTASAGRSLQAAGRSAKKSRAVIDQQAAVVILQDAIDAERSGSTPPGRLVEPPRSDV